MDLVDGVRSVTVTARDLSWLELVSALPRRDQPSGSRGIEWGVRAGDSCWHTKASIANMPKPGDLLTPDATSEMRSCSRSRRRR